MKLTEYANFWHAVTGKNKSNLYLVTHTRSMFFFCKNTTIQWTRHPTEMFANLLDELVIYTIVPFYCNLKYNIIKYLHTYKNG